MTKKREILAKKYTQLLAESDIIKPVSIPNPTSNFGYYPVVFNTESQLVKVVQHLNKNGIFPRRYFNPSLNTLEYVKYFPCPISEDVSRRVLCLPLYYDLEIKEVETITKLILEKL